MVECEDCGDEVKRRFTCFHCGQYICGWCWNHIHGCGPGHKRSECKDYRSYLKHGKKWVERLRARGEVVAHA